MIWKTSEKRNSGNKKIFNQIKNTGESHSSRPEQVEDRISGLEDKIDVKEKTEELLDKRLRSAKGICKNSETPSKEQICQSWALKKEKRSKPQGYVI
jgi:hypothetical protein